MNRRRRRIKEKRKPFSPVSLGAVIAGGVTLLLFFLVLTVSAYEQGNTANILGAVAVVSMVVAIVAFARGLTERKNDNFDLLTRWLGVILPAVAALSWIVLYLIGALLG
jgi:glycerol uptake facilitator-like aquaporin